MQQYMNIIVVSNVSYIIVVSNVSYIIGMGSDGDKPTATEATPC